MNGSFTSLQYVDLVVHVSREVNILQSEFPSIVF